MPNISQNKRQPLLLQDNLSEISSNFLIQEIEDGAKRDGLNIEVYIDTNDIIDMIRGIDKFVEMGAVNINKFNKSRSAIVHGFIYRAWLKNVKVLPPHQDEFLLKLSEPYIFGTFIDSREDIENDFFHKLGFHQLRFDPSKVEDLKRFKNYIKGMREEAVNLFKADYLLREEMSWLQRYKFLFEKKKILEFDQETFELEEREDPKFNTILSTIHAARKNRPKNLSKNNYVDALAMRCLQSKLEQFEESGRKTPLPIFYVSSPSLYYQLKQVIQIEIERAKNESEKPNISLLSYYSKEYEEYIPIIRSTDYFILDVIYNQIEKSQLHSFFRTIQRIKKRFHGDFDSVFHTPLESGESDIKNLALTEFFEKFWLDMKGYEELNQSILDVLRYRDLMKEKNKDEVEQILEKEKKDLLKRIPRNHQRVVLFHDIWRNLENKLLLEAVQVKGMKPLNVMNDFGLTRFSFDSFKDKEGNLVVLDKIVNLVRGILQDYREGDVQALGNKISLIASYATNGLFIKPKGKNLEQNRRYQNLLISLSVLWIFGEEALIVEICEKFERSYPSYHLAVLHASCLYLSQHPDRLTRGKNILECIEGKEDLNNYKVWMSLSYIKFRIWDDKVNRAEFPELVSEEEREKFNAPKTYKYLHGALEYLKDSLEWLEKNMAKDSEKEKYRIPKYYYAINNYIYYMSRGANINEFNDSDLESWVEKLERASTANYWQMRFYDTLAWYNFRKGLISENIREFKYYILLAKRHIDKAIKGAGAKNQSEQEFFQRLDDKIRKIIVTGHNGMKFSPKEIDKLLF